MARDAAGEHWGASGVGEYTAHAYAALTALAARNRLVKEIMATAGTRAALESADIAAVAVKKRLANTLAKTNKKQRAAFDLDPEEPALAGDAL